MKAGDAVTVYPHGDPAQAVAGEVRIISDNGRSIAVSFDEIPPFVRRDPGVPIHAKYGVVMLAMRQELDGKPWGPWIELIHGGHYEIEEAVA